MSDDGPDWRQQEECEEYEWQEVAKEEMKAKLGGQSPDLMDMFMMREWFDLKPAVKLVTF